MNDDAAPQGPLSSDHIRQLATGAVRAKKIRRAATFAAVSGWTMVVLGVLSLAWGLMGDAASIVVGAAVCGLGVNELAGSRLLSKLDPRGPTRLAWNQVMVAAVMVIYACWASYAAWNGSDQSPLVTAGMIDPVVLVTMQLLTYALAGGVGVLVTMLTAIYYRSRGRVLRDMLHETSPWVVETMRMAA